MAIDLLRLLFIFVGLCGFVFVHVCVVSSGLTPPTPTMDVFVSVFSWADAVSIGAFFTGGEKKGIGGASSGASSGALSGASSGASSGVWGEGGCCGTCSKMSIINGSSAMDSGEVIGAGAVGACRRPGTFSNVAIVNGVLIKVLMGTVGGALNGSLGGIRCGENLINIFSASR